MSAHRALPRCTGMCDSGRRDCSCPTGRQQATERETSAGGDSDCEPLSRVEFYQFWGTVAAAAFVFFTGLVWMFKP